ncbi:MAG: hypothetical protein GY716_07065 [bacterium]|nr:hypothetical protein [bacterium]
MGDHRTHYGNRQAGLSLVELLVSVTILAIATVMALTMYDQANKSFKTGENLSEQQQAVRIAFELLTTDIRMAGFNTNPDGNKARPDEQIEAAYPTAIVIRADFDGGDPVAAADPESTLAGDAFLSVSTGNDEIRTYVLVSHNPASRGDSVRFSADVLPGQRDGQVEVVDVDTVSMTLDDPPYTLYRITLDAGAAPVRTVLVENVHRLGFRYYDKVGNEITAPGGGETPADRARRAAIRRITLEIEALTRDPDPTYVDPYDDVAATQHHRKFKLEGDVSPRNLGMAGIKDLVSDRIAPGPPPLAPGLYPGHCGGLNVVWEPNPPADEVAYYKIHYGTDPDNLTGQRAASGTHYFLGGLLDGVEYHVALQAVDAAGNSSPLSAAPVASKTTTNVNTPITPDGLYVTDPPQNGRITLGWTAARENTGTTGGDPEPWLLRDLAGYRVYRGEDSGFVPSVDNRVADESQATPHAVPRVTDEPVNNCVPYHYKITAVDECGIESGYSQEITGEGYSNVPPRVPFDEEAFFEGSGVRVKWSPVTVDDNGDPIVIEHYRLYRTPEINIGVTPSVADFTLPVVDVTDGAVEWFEAVTFTPGMVRWYMLKAVDGCGNESEYSSIAVPTCSFLGSVTIDAPNDGATLTGPTEIHVKVADGAPGASYQDAEIAIFRDQDPTYTLAHSVSLGAGGPLWTYDWNDVPPSGFPDAPYLIRAQVFESSNCSQLTSIRVLVDTSDDDD